MRRMILPLLLAFFVGEARSAESVTPREVPAKGRATALVQVDAFGRYAIFANSPQGSAIQLVDRMAGPGRVAGEAGEENGRLNLFLDRGSYRLWVDSHPLGAGAAALSVKPFAELQPIAPVIADGATVQSTLSDFQQRSWSIELDQSQFVSFEAAGGALGDLRLWRDGAWMEAMTPVVEERSAKTPIRVAQLSGWLEAGRYRLTAYGGAPLGGGDEVLTLRRGVPYSPGPAARFGVMSPFGEDRFWADRSDLFWMSVPSGGAATLSAVPWEPSNPFALGGMSARIDEKSIPPQATLRPGDSGPWLVTLRGSPGQPYALQHFQSFRETTHLQGRGSAWISTLHTGDTRDRLDATGIILSRKGNDVRVAASASLRLGEGIGLERRFNLMNTTTLFVEIAEGGDYRVESEGAVELAITDLGASAPPVFRPASNTWSLNPGFYAFALRPGLREGRPHPGIVTLRVAPPRSLGGAPPKNHPLQIGLQWPSFSFQPGFSYELRVGSLPEVESGIVQRALPIDPSVPLPLYHPLGTTLDIPILVQAEGRVAAVDPKGAPVPSSLDGGPPKPFHEVVPGQYRVHIVGMGFASSTISFTPAARAPSGVTALSSLRMGDLAGAEVVRGSSVSYQFPIAESGLYRVESEGLLDTFGTLGSRTVPTLVEDEDSGSGRNFLLHAWLREGDYRVSAQARGDSAGHLTLRARPIPLTDGGELPLGVAVRASLAPDEGLVYRFRLEEEGDYHLYSSGSDALARARLEDAEGWPLREPGAPADFVEHLLPGSYRVVLLPERGAVRRQTVVEAVAPPIPRVGRGPHPLSFGEVAEQRWREPAEGQPREDDLWSLAVTAPLEVELRVSEGMHGELRLGEREVGTLLSGDPWKGSLEPGDYTLALRNARRDNGATYQVEARADALAPGHLRRLSVPAEVPLSIGQGALVEVRSEGQADVRATLLSAEGEVVWSEDDRPDDWNFQALERLEAGRYLLRVEPVGSAAAQTTVGVRAPEEVPLVDAALPWDGEVELGAKVLLVPLAVGSEEALLTASARSSENIGLSLEREVNGRYETVATEVGRTPSLAARAEGGRWRLRLWSMDARGSAQIKVRLERPRALGEPLRLSALEVGYGGRLANAEEGTFTVSPDLAVCPSPGSACQPAANGQIAAPAGDLWLWSRVPEGALQREILTSEQALSLQVSSRAVLPVKAKGDALVAFARPVAGAAALHLGESPSSGGSGRDSASVSLRGRNPSLEVRSARVGAPLDARISLSTFALSAPLKTPYGSFEGEVPAGEARVWSFPKGARTLSLGAEQGLVVALADGQERVERSVWAADAPVYVEFFDAPTHLYVFNPTGAALRLRATLAEGTPSLKGALEWTATQAGTAVIPHAEALGALQATGAVRSLTHWDAAGELREGRSLDALTPGVLWVEHGVGPWGLQRTEAHAGGKRPARVNLPIALDLSDVTEFTVEAVQALHLRGGQRAVVEVRRGDATPEVLSFPEGISADFLVAPGEKTEVRLRGWGELPLAGPLSVSSSDPIALGEGLGPELLLNPGETRFFYVDLAAPRRLGFGVRASASAVQAYTLDAEGRRLGMGVVQLHELPAGRWYLAVSLPPEAPPARVRPVLVGLVPPPVAPPPEVVERYLRGEEDE